MKERFTHRHGNEVSVNLEDIKDALYKLAEYEDEYVKGKGHVYYRKLYAGQEIYIVFDNQIYKAETLWITSLPMSVVYEPIYYGYELLEPDEYSTKIPRDYFGENCFSDDEFPEEAIGVKVFTTYEEAVKALNKSEVKTDV